jgi:hypothetical protein
LATYAIADTKPSLWKDPGPVETLDLANGPAPAETAPKPPFTFVSEELRGVNPKIVVSDSKGTKWMVKFGEEAKAETFVSRLAWAAGFPVRPNYYLASGQISGADSLSRAGAFVKNGTFQGARFQMFDNEKFREVDGGKLDISQKHDDTLHLNALKLLSLLTANWDVKTANTAVFEVGGQQYATISDWGASMGDPGSSSLNQRKWDCPAFSKNSGTLIEGVENGFVVFNYQQYAGRGIDALTQGIRVEDLKWFSDRLGKLSDAQIRAALTASGASAEEASCFVGALRKRLNIFASAGSGTGQPGIIRSRTVTKTTTTTTTTVPAGEPEGK